MQHYTSLALLTNVANEPKMPEEFTFIRNFWTKNRTIAQRTQLSWVEKSGVVHDDKAMVLHKLVFRIYSVAFCWYLSTLRSLITMGSFVLNFIIRFAEQC